MVSISLRAKGIGTSGMLGVGFGGLTMYDATVSVVFPPASHDFTSAVPNSKQSTSRGNAKPNAR